MVSFYPSSRSGDVSIRGGDSGGTAIGTKSPAAKEAARQQIAWEAGAQFIADLKGLAGGAAESNFYSDKDLDESVFDSQLREALKAEGFNYEEELAKLNRESPDAPEWVTKAEFFLTKMVRNVPDALKERVKEAFDGEDKEDFNTAACLSWAATYFGDYGSDDGIVNMAAILLDYAFVRQGIDDEYVAQVQTPEEHKALPPAEDEKLVHPESETPNGIPELQNLWDAAPDVGALFSDARVVGRVKPTKAAEGAIVRGTGTFLRLVRSRCGAWKPKLARRIYGASSASIYRVAMVNAGLATGDKEAKEALAASYRKAQNPDIFVTLGVAAIALELTDPRNETSYKLHTQYCRTCAGALPNWHGNGCCQMETFAGGGMARPKPKETTIDDIMGYLGDGKKKRPVAMDGVKISHPRGQPWRVNVLPVWGPDRWQNVGSMQEAIDLGNRVLREHRASGNLADAAPRPRPKPAPVPALIDDEDKIAVAAVENAAVDRLVTDMAEGISQRSLGGKIKWAGMGFCALMLFITQSPMWFAFAGVAYVAGWALIDKKGIEARKKAILAAAREQKALPPVES